MTGECGEGASRQVEEALLKRALGYRYTEITMGQAKNPETGELEWTAVKEVTKEVMPELSAQKFWLLNRCPDRWRDKPEPEGESAATMAFEGEVKEYAE